MTEVYCVVMNGQTKVFSSITKATIYSQQEFGEYLIDGIRLDDIETKELAAFILSQSTVQCIFGRHEIRIEVCEVI